MENVLEIRGLRKNFGQTKALRGIDLVVPRGVVFGVVGPNGAGKTTAMRCLLDIIRPSSGSVRVLGEDPRGAGPGLRRRIGYLPGELSLERRTTGRRMLRHFAEISGPVAPGRIDELAARLGLDLDRQSRKLSKGNKQKLGLMQALMHDPELLVLDEPTSGLDPLMQREFLALLREARSRGQTVFLSSHDMGEVQQAADRVAILRAGRIVRTATVDELRSSARRRLRAVLRDVDPARLRARLTALPGLAELAVRELHDAGPDRVAEATGAFGGDLGGLVRALGEYDVVDLVLEEPDLEDAVIQLYGEAEQ